jgi:hypothetical protein
MSGRVSYPATARAAILKSRADTEYLEAESATGDAAECAGNCYLPLHRMSAAAAAVLAAL